MTQNLFSICKEKLGLEILHPANNTFYYVMLPPKISDDR